MFPDIPTSENQRFKVGNVGNVGETSNIFPTFGNIPDIFPTFNLLIFNNLNMLGKLGEILRLFIFF